MEIKQHRLLIILVILKGFCVLYDYKQQKTVLP